MRVPEIAKEMIARVPGLMQWYWRSMKPKYQDYAVLYIWPDVIAQSAEVALASSCKAPPGKAIFLFASLPYWITHTTFLGLTLAGLGHQVTLSYVPYNNWFTPLSRFERRCRELFIRDSLGPAEKAMTIVPLLDLPTEEIPEALENIVREVSLFDSQYTLQAEEVDLKSDLYQLRLERNRAAAGAAYAYLQQNRPEGVIVPNGVVEEFAIIYAVARYLDIPTVTYEFGEQANRAWLALDSQIIKHITDDLWEARKDIPLTPEQRDWLKDFFAGRQTTQRGEGFARLWQPTETRGGQRLRAELGLDQRPVVLLATNVLGDSLTLGRQLFSTTMSEWIERLVFYFADHPEVQLVIRIHPGENLTTGPSLTGVIQKALPDLPEHIHLIGPREKVNTYDLMEIADLGLVYTTTTGLEMAARGIPVMTAGRTHYRGRGFTIDADTYEEYFGKLDQILSRPSAFRLKPEKIELAWNYAYRFFREFPRPFPWHILHLRRDVEKHPLQSVLSPEGQAEYGETLRYMTGVPIDWKQINEF
ncbi:MAG: hypothetical protein JXB85_06075 [Anaerolineales bacterium]|nr:hypothetical protein [Anaerolineales bacterium]